VADRASAAGGAGPVGGSVPDRKLSALSAFKGQPAALRTIALKTSRKLPRVLTADEVQTILDACGRLRDRLLFAALYDTGMRIGEALGLRHETLPPLNVRSRCSPGPRPTAHEPSRRTRASSPSPQSCSGSIRLPARRVRRSRFRLRIRQLVGPSTRPSAGRAADPHPGRAPLGDPPRRRSDRDHPAIRAAAAPGGRAPRPGCGFLPCRSSGPETTCDGDRVRRAGIRHGRARPRPPQARGTGWTARRARSARAVSCPCTPRGTALLAAGSATHDR
jgi:hypothetical protein